jgi:hypothetical protein
VSFKIPTTLPSGNLFFLEMTVRQGGKEFAKFRKTYFLHFEGIKSEAASCPRGTDFSEHMCHRSKARHVNACIRMQWSVRIVEKTVLIFVQKVLQRGCLVREYRYIPKHNMRAQQLFVNYSCLAIRYNSVAIVARLRAG